MILLRIDNGSPNQPVFWDDATRQRPALDQGKSAQIRIGVFQLNVPADLTGYSAFSLSIRQSPEVVAELIQADCDLVANTLTRDAWEDRTAWHLETALSSLQTNYQLNVSRAKLWAVITALDPDDQLVTLGKGEIFLVRDNAEPGSATPGKRYLTEDDVSLMIGPQGPVGPQGPQGPAGPQGATGAKGDKGDQGNQGPAGPQGATGAAGATGAKGDKGNTGAKGDTGAQGPAGTQGQRGLKGDKGDNGAQGLKGDKGDTGAAGADGAAGAQGAPGLKGDKGDTGETGERGDQGVQGIQGLRGFMGLKGEKGAQGAVGPQGPAGPQGAAGAAGAKGDKGDTGNQGAVGPQGPAGPQGATGAAGAKGDKGDTGNQGAVGPQGPAGPQGATGAKGDDGDQGPQGVKGDPGDPGATTIDGIDGLREAIDANQSAIETEASTARFAEANAWQSGYYAAEYIGYPKSILSIWPGAMVYDFEPSANVMTVQMPVGESAFVDRFGVVRAMIPYQTATIMAGRIQNITYDAQLLIFTTASSIPFLGVFRNQGPFSDSDLNGTVSFNGTFSFSTLNLADFEVINLSFEGVDFSPLTSVNAGGIADGFTLSIGNVVSAVAEMFLAALVSSNADNGYVTCTLSDAVLTPEAEAFVTDLEGRGWTVTITDP